MKRRMNALLTRDEVMLATKVNAHGEAAYERPTTYAAKLSMRWSYARTS